MITLNPVNLLLIFIIYMAVGFVVLSLYERIYQQGLDAILGKYLPSLIVRVIKDEIGHHMVEIIALLLGWLLWPITGVWFLFVFLGDLTFSVNRKR